MNEEKCTKIYKKNLEEGAELTPED